MKRNAQERADAIWARLKEENMAGLHQCPTCSWRFETAEALEAHGDGCADFVAEEEPGWDEPPC